MNELDRLHRMRDLFVEEIIRRKPQISLPYRYDGSRVATAHDVAYALNIPLPEAEKRLPVILKRYADLEYKDVHAACGEHTVPVGVGTVVERANTVARRRRIKRKKRNEE